MLAAAWQALAAEAAAAWALRRVAQVPALAAAEAAAVSMPVLRTDKHHLVGQAAAVAHRKT